MTNNTTGFMLVFIKNARRESIALTKVNAIPNLVLDASYSPIQIESEMFLVRARQTGPVKHKDVFSICPESEMAALEAQMCKESS
jgi:hypothetical protein